MGCGMRGLLVIGFIFVIVFLVLMGFVCGIGVLLHWISPSIEIGMGMVIGLVCIGLSVSYTGRILTSSVKISTYYDEDDDEEDIYYSPITSSRKSRKKKR
jgi:hypothetical protein